MASEKRTLPGLLGVGARFLTVGAVSTLIEIAVFNLLVYAVGLDAVPAKLVASLVALVNAYFGSALWTFRGRSGPGRAATILRFLATNAVCAVLGATIIGVLSSVLRYRLDLDGPLWLNLSNVASIGIVIVVRFLLYHLWVFPDAAPADKPPELLTGRAARARAWGVRGILAACLATSLVFSTSYAFADEYDNILGGWLLLNRGELPYVGFFSHHMPLAYFVAAPIVAVTGTDLVLFRLAFALVLFLWLCLIYRTAQRALGTVAGLALVVVMTVLSLGVWAHMLLAETLIAWAVVHAVVLLAGDLARSKRVPTSRDVAVVAVLGAIPVLSSLSYAMVSLIVYIWFGALYLRSARGPEPRALALLALRTIGWLLVPYALFLAYLLLTGSTAAFVAQAYEFNVKYYSGFVEDVSGSAVATLVNSVGQFFVAFGEALAPGPLITQALAAVMAIALVLGIAALVVLGQRLTAAFMVVLVVSASYRGHGVSEVFEDPGGRHTVYAALAITVAVLAGALAAARIPRTRGRARIIPVLALTTAVLLAAPPALAGLRADATVVRYWTDGVPSSIQLTDAGGEKAFIANAVLGPRDYYFVGPSDFYQQLYLDGRRSSPYTFFLPWQAACAECVSELLSDLDQDAPRVVIWHPWQHTFVGGPASEYFPQMTALLDRDYFQVADPRAGDMYFLESDRASIERALREGGVRVD